ncbi:MAG: hypothetical protein IT380_06655 [Myxococcales bacterium]|nr:hypothetical protein [Myxococcales bacterium]
MVLLLTLLLAATPATPAKKKTGTASAKTKPASKAKAGAKTKKGATTPPPADEAPSESAASTPPADAPVAAPAPPAPPPPVAQPPAPPEPAPAAAPSEPAPREKKTVKIAANEWCRSGLDDVVVQTVETRFYDLLENTGIDVIAPKDVAAVLGLERQRQMMGCTEDSSCLAEIGGALGADAVLYGCVVRAGSGFTITLRAVNTNTAKPVATHSERVASEDLLQDWLDSNAKLMALELRQAIGGESLKEEITSASADLVSVTKGAAPAGHHPLRKRAWIPLAAAAAGGATAAVGFIGSNAALADLNRTLEEQGQVTPEAEAIAARGSAMQTVGWIGAGVAAAGLVTAAVFFFLPGKGPAPVAFVGPSGVLVGISGTLP